MGNSDVLEQHYFDAQHYYVCRTIDKTINITETNEKPMTIDIGKGNKLSFKSIPESIEYIPMIEIISLHDSAGNEYADLAGQKIEWKEATKGQFIKMSDISEIGWKYNWKEEYPHEI